MTHNKIIEQIKKTGFILENNVTRNLANAGWTVINNKYYIDDSEEKIREIDLLAYKVDLVSGLSVYTALIISCKKSDSNNWVLLTRKANPEDPNTDWSPLHVSSTEKSIEFIVAQTDKKNEHHKIASECGENNIFATPEFNVFAYQEVNKVTGNIQNDKAIFSSITSLMKAQQYEKSILKKEKGALQFINSI